MMTLIPKEGRREKRECVTVQFLSNNDYMDLYHIQGD